MTIKSLKRIPFYGDTLYLTEHEGEPFTPLKPIVEGMGLDWATQYRKAVSARQRWRIVILTIPHAGGAQNMQCIPVRKLPAFLATVHPNKVRRDLREKIIRYQNECDDVLWQHWSEQHTAQARPDLTNSRWLLHFDEHGHHHMMPIGPTWRLVDGARLAKAWRYARNHVDYVANLLKETDNEMEITLGHG